MILLADIFPVMMFVGIAVLVIAGVVWSFYAAAKRRKILLEWAVNRKLIFNPAKDNSLDDMYPGFECLRRGGSRHAYNKITGDWNGRNICAFDYHYVTGSGKNRSTHIFSAVIVQSNVPLLPLFIRSENVFDKIAGFVGFEDIDFESAEFSRKFFVKSPDRKWAFDVLHARTIEFLLASTPHCIKFDNFHAIAWQDRVFSVPQFEESIGIICGILDGFPEYLVKQQLGE